MSGKVWTDEELVEWLLSQAEGRRFECKRISDKFTHTLESVVALANSDGGLLVLGLEDPQKAQGRNRVYGIQENVTAWDELRRLLKTRITDPQVLPLKIIEIPTPLRDGSAGFVAVLQIQKSPVVHSIVADGTFVRLEKSNKQLTAPEIHDLMFSRGTITAESQIEDVGFDLLDTDIWRQFAAQRRLTRPIAEAMYPRGSG
jgi:ATP-dependent DNA helicase RecG